MSDPTQKHHNGLSNNQVRDLIAAEERNIEVSVGLYAGTDEFRSLLVQNLEEAKKKLADYDMGLALRQVADKFGWTFHDVSEFVDYNGKTYRCFVGTEEERKAIYPDETSKRKR